ncbi:hypothetical protein JHK82_026653 [Glycine max]|uniref:DUF538 domain-containing protein n=2 Tax=Glycine subgen. Soja TaxID=1462606 RepID=A0A0R0HZ32_SOYBN|nr:uncharacterized protein At5g01610 [Glycine max]KAG4981787.1 hypothetical protein JHK87_026536 [Glycine soja]KAG5002635.1 hypothetical protein JHK86_026774 [Glycine max]KAG5125818.1 hypothetical protein JHK82_026653 [Glycine max]KAG5150414.1 hypothetical protein JHK84_026886 [Glycine max]KAH1136281.1 hypothetical protein GYH30_026671 [Glycine max]
MIQLQNHEPTRFQFDSNNRRSMSITTFLLLLLLSPAITATPTAYEMLESFHFPAGILPKGVTGYELDPSSGKFSADLNGSCSFSLEGSYQLSYQKTITGYVSEGRLTELRGISVKILFFWLNILDVVRVGEDLDFSVGVASASFPLDNFFVSPQCGCGLDCDDFRIRKLDLGNRKPSLSSV